jgi:predicted MPP superfamily phosphohydrolase
MQKITWLHLSDFHVGLDSHGQTQLFDYIISHVKQKNKNLDFIFITGDIAQSGLEKEYEKFGNDFLEPLKKEVNKNCKIFIVAGNHDVNRSKFKTFSPTEALKITDFFDPTTQGLENREDILKRFVKYREFQQLYLDSDDWLNSEKGYFVYQNKLKNVNLGVLSINTAWLSKDGKDKGSLTAGKAIIEAGLKEIQNCDVKIVLGHHPLDWFHDKELIGALFIQNQVIYLHGHLHEGSNRYEGSSTGQSFLTIQSGAAFQGREDNQRRNGLLWGALDFNAKTINLEPYKWKKEAQEWRLDGDAFPNDFHDGGVWKLPLPQKIQMSINTKPAIKQKKPFSAPQGWEIIDLGELNKRKTEPDKETILKYFDGRIPNWSLALSKKIPRRQIVNDLNQEINESVLANESSITILLGAGGEGKSTAFLQTIEAILESQNNWKVLYHKEENSKLSQNVMKELPTDCYWLIASDDADLIAEDIYSAANNQFGHIHFLLPLEG